jgi:hypothetical protein
MLASECRKSVNLGEKRVVGLAARIVSWTTKRFSFCANHAKLLHGCGWVGRDLLRTMSAGMGACTRSSLSSAQSAQMLAWSAYRSGLQPLALYPGGGHQRPPQRPLARATSWRQHLLSDALPHARSLFLHTRG